MKYREGSVTDAMQRAQWFLADNREELAELNAGDFARAEEKVDAVLARLITHGVDQDAGDRLARAETAKQRRLRLDLRAEWLKPIAVIARHNLRKVPEYAALQLPKASHVGNGFVISARAMATAAAAHREALISYGLPENFVEELNAAIDEFAASLAERDKNLGRRIGATKGLETETSEARTVLAVLDALMRRWAKENQALLRAWEGTRHIRHRPGPVSVSADSTTSNASETAPPKERPLSMA